MFWIKIVLESCKDVALGNSTVYHGILQQYNPIDTYFHVIVIIKKVLVHRFFRLRVSFYENKVVALPSLLIGFCCIVRGFFLAFFSWKMCLPECKPHNFSQML